MTLSNNSDSSQPSDAKPQPFYRLHGSNRLIARPDSSNPDAGNHHPMLLLFANDRIRVSDFRLGPSQVFSTTHKYPTIRWQVSYDGISQHNIKVSTYSNEETKNKILSGCVQDRTIFFVEAGTRWEITNTSEEGEYRQIIFELLSNKPKYTQQEIEDMFAKAKYSTDVGTKLIFENELCRCWDFYLDPSEGGGHDTVHQHCLDYVFINVAPSRLLGLHPETLSLDNLLFDSISEDNQVTWNSIPKEAATEIAYAHGGKNGYDDRPMREYLVELK